MVLARVHIEVSHSGSGSQLSDYRLLVTPPLLIEQAATLMNQTLCLVAIFPQEPLPTLQLAAPGKEKLSDTRVLTFLDVLCTYTKQTRSELYRPHKTKAGITKCKWLNDRYNGITL